MVLHFKFLVDSAREARQQVLSELLADGATATYPLFDEPSDPETASLYVVESDDDSAEERLLAALEQAEPVEFVEKPVRRHLIW